MNLRQIYRLVYDGYHQKAIELLCEIVEEQDKRITELENKLKESKNNDVNYYR